MKRFKFFTFLLPFFAATFLNAQEDKAAKIVTDWYVAIDAGNTTALAALMAEDFTAMIPVSPQPFDKNSFQGLVAQGFKAAFPDMKHEVLDWFADGNKVAVKGIFRGANTGPMMGNPPTGNRVELPFTALYELDGKGKVRTLNVKYDGKSFETQLMAGINPNAMAEANIRAMLAASDAGDADKFMSYWSNPEENYFAGVKTSAEQMKMRIPAFKTAFPDIRRHLDEVVVSGNTVVVRGWVTGTNKGPFMGQAPTNNPIKVSWLGLYHLDAAGKVIAGWVEFDTATLMNQVKGTSTAGH